MKYFNNLLLIQMLAFCYLALTVTHALAGLPGFEKGMQYHHIVRFIFYLIVK